MFEYVFFIINSAKIVVGGGILKILDGSEGGAAFLQKQNLATLVGKIVLWSFDFKEDIYIRIMENYLNII